MAEELELELKLHMVECSFPPGAQPGFLDLSVCENLGVVGGTLVRMVFYMRFGQGQHFDALLPL